METTVSRDGTVIAYDKLGTGPAVIIVGGAFTTRAMTWPLAELLATDFTVINYDRRGRGDSGDTAPFALEREIEDLAALIEVAGGSAALFGHSSGAALCIEAARVLPGVTKLALYEPPYIVDDSRPPVPEDYVAHLNSLVAQDKRDEIVEYFMTVAVGLPAEFAAMMRQTPLWTDQLALAHTVPYDGAAVAHNMVGKPLPREWATEITVPTLVLDGEKSPDWQRDSVRQLAELLPSGRRHTMPNCDHGAPPEELAPVLGGFLK